MLAQTTFGTGQAPIVTNILKALTGIHIRLVQIVIDTRPVLTTVTIATAVQAPCQGLIGQVESNEI